MSAAGTYKVNVKLSSAAKKALKKKGKLKASLSIKFTPNGGTANQVVRPISIKVKKKKVRSLAASKLQAFVFSL